MRLPWLLPAVGAADLFAVLNVSDFADQDEIKQAYRRQSRIYHPDKYRGDPQEAQDKMVLINEAYRVLSNATLRRMAEYYEDDYEEMADYEQFLEGGSGGGKGGKGRRQPRRTDPYFLNGDVRIFWRQFHELSRGSKIWVVHFHNAPQCMKEIEEFKRFARLAKKSRDIRAAAVNCQIAGQACHAVMQQLGKRFACKVAMVPTGQFSSEIGDLDWVEYDQDWPRAEEVMRVARKKATSRVITVTGQFFSRNVTTNPFPAGLSPVSNASNASNETVPVRIWVAWALHPEGCRSCGETASALRRISNDYQYVKVRFAILNCKEEKDSRVDECRALRKGQQSLKLYAHRPGKRFVQSVPVADKPEDYAVALEATLRMLEHVMKPVHPLLAPPHPDGEEPGEEKPQKPEGQVETWSVKQLRQFLSERGVKCVGCADKSDFVAKVKAEL